jgi:hypothetical protein
MHGRRLQLAFLEYEAVQRCLDGRLAVAEHVVGDTEPRAEILPVEHVLARELPGHRQPTRWRDVDIVVVALELVEPEAGVYRPAVDRPLVLRVVRERIQRHRERVRGGLEGNLVGHTVECPVGHVGRDGARGVVGVLVLE